MPPGSLSNCATTTAASPGRSAGPTSRKRLLNQPGLAPTPGPALLSLDNHIVKTRAILGSLQLFIGMGAVPAGLALMTDPSGASLGMPLVRLEHTPFASYFVPGLALFVVNGVCQIAASIMSFRRAPQSAVAAIALGFFLVLWIVSQVYWIGYQSWLQPAYFLLGILEGLLGWRLQSQE